MRAVEITYELDSDADASATMTLCDAGGGEYLLLNVRQWAFDTPEEIDEFANAMKRLLVRVKESGHEDRQQHP